MKIGRITSIHVIERTEGGEMLYRNIHGHVVAVACRNKNWPISQNNWIAPEIKPEDCLLCPIAEWPQVKSDMLETFGDVSIIEYTE